MQLIVSADQMRAYDRTAIRSYGIPGLLLMENAGREFVRILKAELGDLEGKHIVIICGKGNNGGDGFVIARHLLNHHCSVDVVLLSKKKSVGGDAAVMLNALVKISRASRSKIRFREMTNPAGFRGLRHGNVAVDAILGTGFAGSLAGLAMKAVEWINAHPHYVASVDIPTGVNASSGAADGLAVTAHLTVTMGLGKIGQYVGEGCESSGSVVVADIGIPASLLIPSSRPTFRVEQRDVLACLPRRPRTAHKYSVGKVLVIAGSRAFPGAAALCATSALKAGAGAVVLASPASVKPLLHRKLLEVIVEPMEETSEGTLAATAAGSLKNRMRWADVVVLGPGLSRHEETDSVVKEVLRACDCSLLIDADGLNALAHSPGLLRRTKSEVIVTPHAGELSRLTNETPAGIESRRVDAAREASLRFRCTVVLKGNPTATANRHGNVYLNTTGNPGLATIGSGDVLSGIIGGLWAQGMTSEEAAMAGVFLHGRAGDLAAARLGERSLLAGDVSDHIPDGIISVGEPQESVR